MDSEGVEDRTVSVPANQTTIGEPCPPEVFADSDGHTEIAFSEIGALEVAAIRAA